MLSDWIKIGSFGVDSGQVLITDPCYLEGWKGFEYEEAAIEEMKESGMFEYSYSGSCARTLLKLPENRAGAGRLRGGLGVVSSTGFGDGEYPVYAKFNDEGRVMKLQINFS